MKSTKTDFTLIACFVVSIVMAFYDSRSWSDTPVPPTCDRKCRERWPFNERIGTKTECFYLTEIDCYYCTMDNVGGAFGSCEPLSTDTKTTLMCVKDPSTDQFMEVLGEDMCDVWCPVTPAPRYGEAWPYEAPGKGKEAGKAYRCKGS